MENNRDENVYYVDENGHRVVETSEAPQGLSKKAKKIWLACGATILILGAILFGPKLMELIAKINGESLDNVPTDKNLTYTSEKAPAEDAEASVVTPEPTIDPEAAKAVEEERIEEASIAYYERLSEIPYYANNYDTVLEHVKRLNKNYSSLLSLEGLDSVTRDKIKLKYYREVKIFLGDSMNATIAAAHAGTIENIDFDSEEIYADDKNGKNIMKTLEDLGAEAYIAGKTKDPSFEEKVSQFLSLASNLYFSATTGKTTWNGITLPDVTKLDAGIEMHLRSLILEILRSIEAVSNGKNFIASDNVCINLQLLLKWFEGGIECDQISIYDSESLQKFYAELEDYDLYRLHPELEPTPSPVLTLEP